MRCRKGKMRMKKFSKIWCLYGFDVYKKERVIGPDSIARSFLVYGCVMRSGK